jgi:hypothetical protein
VNTLSKMVSSVVVVAPSSTTGAPAALVPADADAVSVPIDDEPAADEATDDELAAVVEDAPCWLLPEHAASKAPSPNTPPARNARRRLTSPVDSEKSVEMFRGSGMGDP